MELVVIAFVVGLVLMAGAAYAGHEVGWRRGQDELMAEIWGDAEEEAEAVDGGALEGGRWGEPVGFAIPWDAIEEAQLDAAEEEAAAYEADWRAGRYVKPAVSFASEDDFDGGYGEVPDVRVLDSDEVRAAIREILWRRTLERGQGGGEL